MKKKIFLGDSTSFFDFYLFIKEKNYVVNHLNFFSKKDFSNFFMFSQINNKVFFSISLFFEDEKICKILSKSLNVIAVYTPILNMENYFYNCEKHFDKNIKYPNNYLFSNEKFYSNKFELLNDYFFSKIKEKNKECFFYLNKKNEKKDKFEDFILKNPNPLFLIASTIIKKIYIKDKKIDYLLHLYLEISDYFL